jgi:hypothetical protein
VNTLAVAMEFDDATKARIDEFAQLVKRAEDAVGALRRETDTARSVSVTLTRESVRAADERVRLGTARTAARNAVATLARYLELIDKVGPAITRAAAAVEAQAEQKVRVMFNGAPIVGFVEAPPLKLAAGKFYEDTRGYKWCVYDAGVSIAMAVDVTTGRKRQFQIDGKSCSNSENLVREVAP